MPFSFHLARLLPLLVSFSDNLVIILQALAPKSQLVEFTSQFVTFHGVPKQSLLGAILCAAQH